MFSRQMHVRGLGTMFVNILQLLIIYREQSPSYVGHRLSMERKILVIAQRAQFLCLRVQ